MRQKRNGTGKNEDKTNQECAKQKQNRKRTKNNNFKF